MRKAAILVVNANGGQVLGLTFEEALRLFDRGDKTFSLGNGLQLRILANPDGTDVQEHCPLPEIVDGKAALQTLF